MKQNQKINDGMDVQGLKIDRVSEHCQKKKRLISKKDMITMKRRTKRNLTYVSWLDNEHRMKNLIIP
ncbi:MAG: hypothetical protein ABI462_03145 [Ignavibacteria bacterium]